MFYQAFKFHVNRVNTFAFMEEAHELQQSPGGIGLRFDTDANGETVIEALVLHSGTYNCWLDFK